MRPYGLLCAPAPVAPTCCGNSRTRADFPLDTSRSSLRGPVGDAAFAARAPSFSPPSVKFYLVPAYGQPPADATFPCALLRDDNWNDHGIRTLWNLRFYPARNNRIEIGDVKIMRIGYTDTPLRRSFTRLETDCCSLGQSLDYYRKLGALGEDVFRPLLGALRDVVLMPSLQRRFKHDEVFNTSLLRFSEAQKAIEVGREYLFSPERDPAVGPPGDFRFTFETTVPGAAAPHTLSLDFRPDDTDLYRIAAVIGRNGTGKTQVLAQFAKAMSGLADERTDPPWRFKPARPGFSRVMALSFSAFDDFERPRAGRSFSYTYCGLRRPDGPTDADQEHEPEDDGAAENESEQPAVRGERAEYALRTPAEMREGLQRALNRIGVLGRSKEWGTAMTTALGGAVELRSLVYRRKLVPDGFARLSAGQRMLMLVLSELVAGLEEEAIVLFDEPELYLHPDALSALTRALHDLLHTFNCYAILATHSPIVLQEVPARLVRVFRREGDVPLVEPLEIESFGESLSTITDKVFELTPAAQNYRAYLARLTEDRPAETVIAMFREPGLGMHARSFVRALARGRDSDVRRPS